MKAYRIKKREHSQPFKIKEIRAAFPKPKLPLIFIRRIHKPSVFVEFTFDG
jgi:hypothetical protein